MRPKFDHMSCLIRWYYSENTDFNKRKQLCFQTAQRVATCSLLIYICTDMVHAAIFFLSEYLIMLPSNCLSRVLELFPSVIQLTRKWLWLTSPFAPT